MLRVDVKSRRRAAGEEAKKLNGYLLQFANLNRAGGGSTRRRAD
jgi:hypothetical protein